MVYACTCKTPCTNTSHKKMKCEIEPSHAKSYINENSSKFYLRLFYCVLKEKGREEVSAFLLIEKAPQRFREFSKGGGKVKTKW